MEETLRVLASSSALVLEALVALIVMYGAAEAIGGRMSGFRLECS